MLAFRARVISQHVCCCCYCVTAPLPSGALACNSVHEAHAGVAAGALGRDAPRVVLYEDASRRKLRHFTALLSDLSKIEAAVDCFAAANVQSPVLAALTTFGKDVPDFREALAALKGATDWRQAEEAGRIVPNEGVDAAYDKAEGSVKKADEALQVRWAPNACQLQQQRHEAKRNQLGLSHKGCQALCAVPLRLACHEVFTAC